MSRRRWPPETHDLGWLSPRVAPWAPSSKLPARMRFLLTGAAALALLGPAATAAAEPCVCLTGTPAEGPVLEASFPYLDLADGSALADAPLLADAPASVPTEGEDALSRPVEELISPPLFIWVEEPSLGGAPAPVQKVLWCEGSDDPRCSPAHGDPVTPEIVSPPPAAPASVTSAPRPRGLHADPFVREGLDGARGVRRALERPPRA